LARHFIARSLLEARSLEDAVGRVAIPDRAAGFNYNIGSHAERRIIRQLHIYWDSPHEEPEKCIQIAM